MPDNLVTVARFLDPITAQLARNRLEAEGVAVLLTGDAAGGPFPGMGGAFNAVHLQVSETDYQRAIDLLEAADRELTGDDDATSEQITEEPKGNESDVAGNTEIQAAATKEAGHRGTETDITAKRKQSRPKREEKGERDRDVQVTWEPDDYARRAWLAAVFGLMALAFAFSWWGGFFFIFIPVQLYSAWLLLRLATHSGELSPGGTWKMYGALIANGLVAFFFLTFFMWRLRWW